MSKQPTLFEEDTPKEIKGIPLEDAKDIANNALTMIDNYCERIEIVGSIRRERPKVNDIDFLVLTDNRHWAQLRNVLVSLLNAKIVCSGNKILRTLIPATTNNLYAQLDLYRVTEGNYGMLKLIRTGSADHNVWLSKFAIKHGMRLLHSTGVLKGDKTVIIGYDESLVFKTLGLPYVEPKQREIVNDKPVWLK